jgi:hypothetical protein
MKLSPNMFLESCGGDQDLAEKVCTIAQSGDMLGAMQMAQQGFVPTPKVDEREEMTDREWEEMKARNAEYDQQKREIIRPAVESFLASELPEGFSKLEFSEEEAFNSTGKALPVGESDTHLLTVIFRKGGEFITHADSKGPAHHGKHDTSLRGTRWE